MTQKKKPTAIQFTPDVAMDAFIERSRKSNVTENQPAMSRRAWVFFQIEKLMDNE